MTAALTLSFASLTPVAAHASAATPRTYFVGGGDGYRACSDSGPGTAALPLCTIQQAAALAQTPGDVVSVAAGNYFGEVDITASGTASAPITFETGPAVGYGWPAALDGAPSTPYGYAFNITSSSYVNVDGFQVNAITHSSEIQIANSSHITIDGDSVTAGNQTSPTLAVTGDSSDVTLSRDQIQDTQGSSGIEIDGGNGDVVTTDVVFGIPAGAGISVQGAANTTVTGNTVYNYCGAGISLSDTASGTASGATIENNVVAFPDTQSSPSPYWPCTGATSAAISLASTADTEHVTENYNAVYTSGVTGAAEYSWAGTSYSSPAAMHAATGQGAADVDSNPDIDNEWPAGQIDSESSPLISSADSNAPGELATDANYATRSCDPHVTPTGVGSSACYDRGAFQYADTVTDTGVSFPPQGAPTGASLTTSAGTATSNWAGATFRYTYVFGDGTSLTTSATSAQHIYATPGWYRTSVIAVSSLGGSHTTGSDIFVNAPKPLGCTPAVTITSGLGVQAAVSTTSAWTIMALTVNWGDGTSSAFGPNYNPSTETHAYAKAGTYVVSCSITDADGESSSSSVEFSTASDYTPYGPARLLDTRSEQGGTSSELAHDGSITLKVAGTGNIPANVRAVALNLTALDATGNGFIQIDSGQDTGTSNLNYGASGIYSNSVIAPVSAAGTVTLTNDAPATSTKLDLLADVSGYFAASSTSGYTPTAPARIMDTRNGVGGSTGPLAAGGTDILTVSGAGGGVLPATGITAVSVNLTIAGTTKEGFLSAYPDGTATPGVSNEDWTNSATTKAIAAIVPVGADGKIDLHNGSNDGGETSLIVDVTGYFSASSPGVYVPVTPERIFDTRTSTGPVSPDSAFAFDFLAHSTTDQLPEVATAYVLNTTVTETTGSGWLAVVPHGATPDTSSLNWIGANQTAANLTIASNTANGQIDFYNGGSTTDKVEVLADLMGYFVHA